MVYVIILIGLVLLFYLNIETINWFQLGLTIFTVAIYIVYDIHRKRKEE